MKIWLTINKTRWHMARVLFYIFFLFTIFVTKYFEYAQRVKIKYKSGKFLT